MAEPMQIEQLGNQMLILMDDDTRYIAYPSPIGIYIVTKAEEPTPDPPPVGPPPPPGSGTRFRWPLPLSTVFSEYGPRGGRVHQGIDLSPAGNPPIPAGGTGRIVYLDAGNSGFGYHARIDHGDGFTTVYGHMIRGSGTVPSGSLVQIGQIIGTMGNTGGSFGDHLHWETHRGPLNWNNPGSHMNPRDFMQKYANG